MENEDKRPLDEDEEIIRIEEERLARENDEMLSEPEEELPVDANKPVSLKKPIRVKENDFTGANNSELNKNKHSKSSSASKTVGSDKSSSVNLGDPDSRLFKYTFGAAVAGVAIRNTGRMMKLKGYKKKIELLNSEKTRLSNMHSGRSVASIMNELEIKSVQKKADRLEKKVHNMKKLMSIGVGAASALGHVASKRGMAEVIAEGSTSGASRDSIPTIDRSIDVGISEPAAAAAEPSM